LISDDNEAELWNGNFLRVTISVSVKSYRDFLEKREYLKSQIAGEHTGTAEELAKKLMISRRTLFYYFGLLDDEGKCVRYCRIRKTYYFEKKMR